MTRLLFTIYVLILTLVSIEWFKLKPTVYNVKCSGAYIGEATRVTVNDYGTRFMSINGIRYQYSPSVQCEVIRK